MAKEGRFVFCSSRGMKNFKESFDEIEEAKSRLAFSFPDSPGFLDTERKIIYTHQFTIDWWSEPIVRNMFKHFGFNVSDWGIEVVDVP